MTNSGIKRFYCIAVFSMMFIFMLTWSACSHSDDPDDPDDQEKTIESVIDELEKKGNFKIFIQALKNLELEDSPMTFFAVGDEVFGMQSREVSGMNKDDLKRHIVKGAYTDLLAVNTLNTIGNEVLQVENTDATIDGAEHLVYLNNTIINTDYVKVENNIIYTINKIIPQVLPSPPTADEKDYLEWFGKRMQGRWRVIETKRYTIRTDWDGYKETVTIKETVRGKPESEYINRYEEIFNWDVIDKEKGIYGDYTVMSQNDLSVISQSQNINPREKSGAWSLDFLRDNLISLYCYREIAGVLRRHGHIDVDRKYGVGVFMKYVDNQLGYSLLPPNNYPMQRDSLVYTLQKVTNW